MKQRLTTGASSGKFASFLLILGCVSVCNAQCVDSSLVNGFAVREIRLKTWLGLVPADLSAQLNAHRGEPYSAQRASVYQTEVARYLAGNETQRTNESLVAQVSKLVASGRLVYLECVERINAKECTKSFSEDHNQPIAQCVDVVLKAYSVDINVLNSSPYLVLLPRSALSTFYAAIPRPLIRLNPSFASIRDEAFGYGFGFNTTTDLLTLSRGRSSTKNGRGSNAGLNASEDRLISGDDELQIVDISRSSRTSLVPKNEEVPATQFLLGLQGLKSINKSYYKGNISLRLLKTRPARTFQTLSLKARFDSDELPQGESAYRRNAVQIEMRTDIAPKSRLMRLISLSGNYSRSHNHLNPGDQLPSEAAIENVFGAQVSTNGMLKKGLVRLFRLSWKWRERSSVKIAERTYEERAQALHC